MQLHLVCVKNAWLIDGNGTLFALQKRVIPSPQLNKYRVSDASRTTDAGWSGAPDPRTIRWALVASFVDSGFRRICFFNGLNCNARTTLYGWMHFRLDVRIRLDVIMFFKINMIWTWSVLSNLKTSKICLVLWQSTIWHFEHTCAESKVLNVKCWICTVCQNSSNEM